MSDLINPYPKLAASLKKLNDSTPGNDFIFHFAIQPGQITHLAPNVFKRNYSANYAAVPVALSDHAPREFRANNATEMTVEFTIVSDRQLSVEPSLKKLRDYMRKDRQTGEPPDMIFSMGSKSWSVRIDRMEHEPRLWNPDTEEQRVHVTLQMHTLAWET